LVLGLVPGNTTVELQARLDSAVGSASVSCTEEAARDLAAVGTAAERIAHRSRNSPERIAAHTIRVKALLAHADVIWGRGQGASAERELEEAIGDAKMLRRFDLVAMGLRLRALTAAHLGQPVRATAFARAGLDALARTDPAMTAPIRASLLCEHARSEALTFASDRGRARAFADEAVSLAWALPATGHGPIGHNYHGFNPYEAVYYRAVVAALIADDDRYRADAATFENWVGERGAYTNYLTSICLEGAASQARRSDADGLLHSVEQAVRLTPTPVTANQLYRAERVIAAARSSAMMTSKAAEARLILTGWIYDFQK